MPGRDVVRLARDLEAALRGQFVSVRTSRSTEDQLGRQLGRAEDYLSLVGLIIVILGGVGIWSVIRVFVAQTLRNVAILKCVGGGVRQILAIYLAQVVLMGLTGSAIGLVLAAVAVARLGPVVAAATGLEAAVGLTASAAAQGAGIGLLVALLFARGPAAGGPPRAPVAPAARLGAPGGLVATPCGSAPWSPSARCWRAWRPGRPARGAQGSS